MKRCEDCQYFKRTCGSNFGRCKYFPPRFGNDGQFYWGIVVPDDWCRHFLDSKPFPALLPFLVEHCADGEPHQTAALHRKTGLNPRTIRFYLAEGAARGYLAPVLDTPRTKNSKTYQATNNLILIRTNQSKRTL